MANHRFYTWTNALLSWAFITFGILLLIESSGRNWMHLGIFTIVYTGVCGFFILLNMFCYWRRYSDRKFCGGKTHRGKFMRFAEYTQSQYTDFMDWWFFSFLVFGASVTLLWLFVISWAPFKPNINFADPIGPNFQADRWSNISVLLAILNVFVGMIGLDYTFSFSNIVFGKMNFAALKQSDDRENAHMIHNDDEIEVSE